MYILPERLREEFKQLFGELMVEPTPEELLGKVKNRSPIVCVGDMVTYTLWKANVHMDLAVVDFSTGRRKFPLADTIRDIQSDRKKVKNQAGQISEEAYNILRKELKGKFPKERPLIIEVDGEEDLLLLPAIRYSPDSAILFYGQPGEGMVAVIPNTELKNQINEYLGEMEEFKWK